MEGSFADKYAFIGEWYDTQSSLVRRFNMFFYPTDETMEMFELKTRKMYLRRMKVNGITLESFFIGCTLFVHGRLIKVLDFACEDTKTRLQKDLEVTFALIKPMPLKIAGKIITHFFEHGLKVTKMKKARLTPEDITDIYSNMVTDQMFPFLLEHLSGNFSIGMVLVGKNAIELSMKVTGNRDPTQAEPGTIRALYGTDKVRNCLHLASSEESARKGINYFFPPSPMQSMRLRLTATLSNCTLCLVKPHAIREGKLGAILGEIDDGGFDITALNMPIVESVNAGEFYEVYKGIVPEYKGMVEELASGPCVAMEIVSKDKSLNSAIEFRKLVGPADPEIARLLRPHTLRAKFGETKVKNAIHCSDLAEDGLLEVEYFFKILDL